MLAADITTDYNNSDPGPKHACAAGGLAASNFDNDAIQNGTNASFELLPGSSYTCVSQSGAGTGQMSWNNATKTLTDQRQRLPRRQPHDLAVGHLYGHGRDRGRRDDHLQRQRHGLLRDEPLQLHELAGE